MVRGALLILVIAAACVPLDVPPSPPPRPPRPCEELEIGCDDCRSACWNLQKLQCPAGGNTPAGADCLDVCDNVVEQGTIPIDLECLTWARSCTEAERC